eukprot:385370-Amphidinium_carterae.1
MNGSALQYATEALKSDPEVVQAAVRQRGFALQYATEALKSDCDVVLTAVQRNGCALEYASEAVRADREVVEEAVRQDEDALRWAADELLEDASFATEEKRPLYLLKVTMLSGRSTVVAAAGPWSVEAVLNECRRRLGLRVAGARMELWHGSGEIVPADGTRVRAWPGIQPEGEISEYQLVVHTR